MASPVQYGIQTTIMHFSPGSSASRAELAFGQADYNKFMEYVTCRQKIDKTTLDREVEQAARKRVDDSSGKVDTKRVGEILINSFSGRQPATEQELVNALNVELKRRLGDVMAGGIVDAWTKNVDSVLRPR